MRSALEVTERGEVLGTVGNWPPTTVVWRDGVVVCVRRDMVPADISERGHVVGYPAALPATHYWSDGVHTVAVPFPSGPAAVNDDGRVLGGWLWFPYVWQQGWPTLGPLPESGTSWQPRDITNQGDALLDLRTSPPAEPKRTVVWRVDGTTRDVGRLGGPPRAPT
jgi:hypothetical protein